MKPVAIVIKVTAILAIIAAVSSGCGGPAEKVEVYRIGPRAIEETVMVAGNLEASSPAQVIPGVWGTVSQIYVEEGQEVAAGQTLVQLDTSNLEQSLLSAQAGLESTQAIASIAGTVSNISSGLTSSLNNISNSISSVLQTADAGVSSLVNFLAYLIPLLPEEQRQAALQAVDNLKRSAEQARSQMPATTAVPGFGGGGMSTGASQAAAGKAIENARKDLQAATITAPVAGTVISTTTGGLSMEGIMASFMSSFSGMIPSGLNLSALTGLSTGMGSMGIPTSGPLVPGSFVSNGTPIFSIVDLKNMSVVAKVDETDIAKVRQGQKATVTLEAYPGKKFKGKVVRIADTATTNEAGATAFEVTIQLDPVDMNLKIGMTATADVVIATRKAAKVVPIEAVVEKNNKDYVFRVVDGKADLTEVRLGLRTEDRVEIAEGVEMGDRVVTRGAEKLKDGQGVKE